MRRGVLNAIQCTENPHVRQYLRKALRVYRSNAAGKTKAALRKLLLHASQNRIRSVRSKKILHAATSPFSSPVDGIPPAFQEKEKIPDLFTLEQSFEAINQSDAFLPSVGQKESFAERSEKNKKRAEAMLISSPKSVYLEEEYDEHQVPKCISSRLSSHSLEESKPLHKVTTMEFLHDWLSDEERDDGEERQKDNRSINEDHTIRITSGYEMSLDQLCSFVKGVKG